VDAAEMSPGDATRVLAPPLAVTPIMVATPTASDPWRRTVAAMIARQAEDVRR